MWYTHQQPLSLHLWYLTFAYELMTDATFHLIASPYWQPCLLNRLTNQRLLTNEKDHIKSNQNMLMRPYLKKTSSLPIPGNEVEFGRLDDLVVVGNNVGLIVVIFVVSSSFSSPSSSFSHLLHVCKHFLTTSSQPALFRSSRHSRKIKYAYLL